MLSDVVFFSKQKYAMLPSHLRKKVSLENMYLPLYMLLYEGLPWEFMDELSEEWIEGYKRNELSLSLRGLPKHPCPKCKQNLAIAGDAGHTACGFNSFKLGCKWYLCQLGCQVIYESEFGILQHYVSEHTNEELRRWDLDAVYIHKLLLSHTD